MIPEVMLRKPDYPGEGSRGEEANEATDAGVHVDEVIIIITRAIFWKERVNF